MPIAVMLKKLELGRLLRPEKFAETAYLARLQPYDPDKTVVLVIHGLMDSQATWTPMINELRGDPEIRKHYQFWFYSYPSGSPYPYSAAILRREMDAVRGDRGKGGHKDKTKPVMSDGVVPYWSYHMEGAQSELVVPSSHSAHQNPRAIEEVDRILKLHAR